MARGHWSVVLRHVQDLFQGASVAGLSEGQLLERFVADRDDVAFGAILARHGPMVLGICRRILRDPHEVDDAFQATFLILVKKARGLHDRDRLGPWLHGVARRVALRARSNGSRAIDPRDAGANPLTAADAIQTAENSEIQELIREEVDRLSNNDRMAVVLCYLDGLTHEEAANRLGWPVGTVKGRLSRAREKLRGRLTRRGVTLPTLFLETLGWRIPDFVPASLVQSTTRAAIQLASGKELVAGVVSTQTVLLMQGAIGTMFATPLKIVATSLLATGVLAIPAVIAFRSTMLQVVPAQVSSPSAVVLPAENQLAGEKTVPSKESDLQIAEQALDSLKRLVASGEVTFQAERIYLWSRRLLEAKSAPGTSEPERRAALQVHLDRMKKTLEAVQKLASNGNLNQLDVLEFRFRVNEAERWVRDGKIEGSVALAPTSSQPTGGAGGFGGGFGGGRFGGESPPREPLILKQTPQDTRRNEVIYSKLEEPLTIDFPEGTTLEQVKKFLTEKTRDPNAGFPDGIPIYIDPEGLQNADKTMQSPVTISLNSIPLRTTLTLLLHQLGLAYQVTGGLILISDEDPRSPFDQEAPSDFKRNEAIEAKLDLDIAMNFPDDSTLVKLKKHIEESTRDEAAGFPDGIPIYFDPVGLTDADKSMNNTFHLEIKGVPLRTTLRIVLRQVGLDYRVTGGLLLIADLESIKAREPKNRVLGFQ